jgi:hypothetical protein
MSEERFDQEQGKDEEQDVEAHRKAAMANDEGGSSEDESDDVEAHARRASHKNL